MNWAILSTFYAGEHVRRRRRGLLEPANSFLLILFAAVFTAPSTALDWSKVDPNSGQLILRAPGLPDTPSRLESATERWDNFELGRWQAANRRLPEAQLILIYKKDIAPSNIHFIKGEPLSESLRRWFSGESLEMLDLAEAKNELGELETQRFRRPGNVDCLAVEQGISTFSDSIDFDSGARLLGDKIIRGWYCIPENTSNADEVLTAFVAGIGLKGFADPARDPQFIGFPSPPSKRKWDEFLKNNYTMQICHETGEGETNANPAKYRECISYIQGWIEADKSYAKSVGREPMACVPDGIEAELVRQAVLDYVTEHVDAMDLRARQIVENGIVAVWPCP